MEEKGLIVQYQTAASHSLGEWAGPRLQTQVHAAAKSAWRALDELLLLEKLAFKHRRAWGGEDLCRGFDPQPGMRTPPLSNSWEAGLGGWGPRGRRSPSVDSVFGAPKEDFSSPTLTPGQAAELPPLSLYPPSPPPFLLF